MALDRSKPNHSFLTLSKIHSFSPSAAHIQKTWGRAPKAGSQRSWFQFCVDLGKSFSLPDLQFSHLSNGAIMTPISQVCRTFSEMMEATLPAWGAVPGGHHTVVSGLGVDSGPKHMSASKQLCDLSKALRSWLPQL